MSKPTRALRRATELWVSRTGIDWATYKVLFKDTLAPAIGLAANQATPWSNVFGTLGFLVPMASIISHPSPPRAEFLRLWIANVVGSCVSAAVMALAFFCVIKAREQSEGPIGDPKTAPYNAVASTVAAIWLIVQTYFISAIRYNYPWTAWMTSACLVFSNYGMVYVVQFPNMTKAMDFVRQMLLAHLVGFCISAGMSLFVFPTNNRERFRKTVSSCMKEIRLAMCTNVELMEHIVRNADSSVSPELDAARKQHKDKLDSLQTKLVTQLQDAKNEIVWGVLKPEDLGTLTHLLEQIIIPVIGLCRIPDVMEHTVHDDDSSEKDRKQSIEHYRDLLNSVILPFSRASAVADTGLRCGEAILGLDVPAGFVEDSNPDKEAPIPQLQHEMDRLVESKADLLSAWHSQHDNSDSESTAETPLQEDFSGEKYDQSRESLHMLLYTELLLWSICHRTQELLAWTEKLKAAQTLQRKRLIMPEWTKPEVLASALRQWTQKIKDTLSDHNDTHRRPKQRRQPLPLRLLQTMTRFLASPASGFALRVTAATMSIAIVAYLPSTQSFYITQHLIWAQYAVSYAMQGTAGQGTRALAFRMGGTVAAVCLAWFAWYAVAGIPAGVLVFYWLGMHFPAYVMALRPRFHVVGTVSAFALTTVLGNALQPDGPAQSTLVLGAVRLAAISGGCLLATLWTLFPFPVSDLDGARGSLGACLACLAEYHTGFREVVRVRLGEGLGREGEEAGRRAMEDVHSRLLVKCNSHLQVLRSRLRLTKWNLLTHGVLFSRTHYERTCEKIDDLMRNMQLITFATGVFIDFVDSQPTGPLNRSIDWLVDFRELFDVAQHDGISVASLLGLLAYSIRNEASLPPNLISSSPLQLWSYFDNPKRVALQVRRVGDPGAATFALMRIGMKGLYKDLEELFQIVRDMVGESDFVCGFAVDEEE